MQMYVQSFVLKIFNFKQFKKNKCQDIWNRNNVYYEDFHWTKIWINLKRLDICNRIKEFKWNCIHNIIYTKSRLRKMNLSNGRCHLCKESSFQEDFQHLFFKSSITNHFISKITILINTIHVVYINETNMMFGFNMEGKNQS